MQWWKTMRAGKRDEAIEDSVLASGELARDTVPLPAMEGADVPAEESTSIASQWQLMWWKFRRHRLAMVCGVIVILFYVVAIFVEFIAPYNPNEQDATQRLPSADARSISATPRAISTGGRLSTTRPVRATWRLSSWCSRRTRAERSRSTSSSGASPTSCSGFIPWDRHLFGVEDPDARFFVLGADSQGQDVFSRLIYGTRISMSIGLVGVAISFILGIVIGGISGYYGGGIDTFIQRVIEFVRSIPTIPLWLGLAAALPPTWSILQIYLAITIILSLIGWTGLARVVRGGPSHCGKRTSSWRHASAAPTSRESCSSTWCHRS